MVDRLFMHCAHLWFVRAGMQVPLAEAGSKCRHQWMRDALQAWINRNGWQHLIPAAAAAAEAGGGAVSVVAQQSTVSEPGGISSL